MSLDPGDHSNFWPFNANGCEPHALGRWLFIGSGENLEESRQDNDESES